MNAFYYTYTIHNLHSITLFEPLKMVIKTEGKKKVILYFGSRFVDKLSS
jgi:hypothetical protein